MKIYLVGYMGSGKSTFGQQLAIALGIPFTDQDKEFEKRYKIGIPDFFSKYGEEAFRDLETKILSDISQLTDAVISTGGGTPCFFDNMMLMNQTGITIYLQASPQLLLSRIEPSAWKRPVFQKFQDSDPLSKITEHLKTREVYYKQARITIDALDPDIEHVKKLILSS